MDVPSIQQDIRPSAPLGYCPWMKHYSVQLSKMNTQALTCVGLGLDGGLGKEGINIWEDPMHKPSLPLFI